MELDNLNEKLNLKIKRRRKKSSYKKVNNESRHKLINMVFLKDYLLKDAARILEINYSTAKTILRIFRLEKRVEKKNAEQERQLKSFLEEYQKKVDNSGSPSPFPTTTTPTLTASQEQNSDIIKVEKNQQIENEYMVLNSAINEISTNVKNCFDNIKLNQNILNVLFNLISQVNSNSSNQQN